MIDMHCHILPGIDDGAKDLDTALEMLRIAEENGTTGIVATPHVIEGAWLPDWEEILVKCQNLQAAAREEGLSITLCPGAELAINLDILDRLTKPGQYCINGGSYILVELPAVEIPNYTEDFFFTLQARGINPILAHPERHPMIIKKPQILVEWVQKGLLVQMNGPSLTGKMGDAVMRSAQLLLDSNLVHVIGSDAHSKRTRNPNLAEASAKIAAMIDVVPYRELMFDNPVAILESREIKVAETIQLMNKNPETDTSSWFTKLRKVF